MRTILIDDEPRGLNAMQKLLQLNCFDVEIISLCSNVDVAVEKISELKPDLIFLDIAMPGKNGFDLLKELEDFQFEVIFVTAHNKFMIEAFHVSAIDYLLKPVDDELLIDAVARARKRSLEKRGNKNIQTLLHNAQNMFATHSMKLCLPSLKGFQVVELSDILYTEASGNYTYFHFTKHGSICSSKPIHEYENMLADAGFVRIHKSYIANLVHVKEYIRGEGGSVVLSNGKELEVSRRKKEALMLKMKSFYKF